jgi:phosphate/sulfate permease
MYGCALLVLSLCLTTFVRFLFEQYQDDPHTVIIGMTAAMAGAFIMVFIATVFSLPVSGTHAVGMREAERCVCLVCVWVLTCRIVVGAIMGFSIAASGLNSIRWVGVGMIVLSWLVRYRALSIDTGSTTSGVVGVA